jgi:hypothetical protein
LVKQPIEQNVSAFSPAAHARFSTSHGYLNSLCLCRPCLFTSRTKPTSFGSIRAAIRDHSPMPDKAPRLPLLTHTPDEHHYPYPQTVAITLQSPETDLDLCFVLSFRPFSIFCLSLRLVLSATSRQRARLSDGAYVLPHTNPPAQDVPFRGLQNSHDTKRFRLLGMPL